VEIEPDKIKTLLISEAPPEDAGNYFYAARNPFYLQTTLQAFNDAGFKVASMKDVLNLGVYVTTAIKCGKTAYSISPKTIDNCSIRVLENEMNLFPEAKAILLMGDTAIKAMNYIAKKKHRESNYSQWLHLQDKKRRVFLQTIQSLPFIPTDRQELSN
jgi:uracil-DNA glycosylase